MHKDHKQANGRSENQLSHYLEFDRQDRPCDIDLRFEIFRFYCFPAIYILFTLET